MDSKFIKSVVEQGSTRLFVFASGVLSPGSKLTMQLALEEDGSVTAFPNANGEPRAKLATSCGKVYTYITPALLAKLLFDDNGITVFSVPKALKAGVLNRTFSL